MKVLQTCWSCLNSPSVRVEPCSTCDGTGQLEREREDWADYRPAGTLDILAKYFDIDLIKIEQEKRAMLDLIRSNGDGPP